MSLFLQILGICFVVCIISALIIMWMIIKNLISKIESYDAYFHESQDYIVDVLDTMKRIHLSGAFEADDVVGEVFTKLRNIVEGIDKLLVPGKKKEQDRESNEKS